VTKQSASKCLEHNCDLSEGPAQFFLYCFTALVYFMRISLQSFAEGNFVKTTARICTWSTISCNATTWHSVSNATYSNYFITFPKVRKISYANFIAKFLFILAPSNMPTMMLYDASSGVKPQGFHRFLITRPNMLWQNHLYHNSLLCKSDYISKKNLSTAVDL